MHPFGKLTKGEVRVLRDRFIRCGAPPDPADEHIIDQLKRWLDEATR